MSEPPPDYEKGQHPVASVQGLSPQMPPNLPTCQGEISPHVQYGNPVGQAPQPQYSQQQHMMMQPTHHSQTTVIVTQPTAAVQNDRMIGTRDGHRDWSSGLFSCCNDMGNCMWVMCCPSCALGSISNRLGECCCVTCCVPMGLVSVRTRIRTLGGIRGSICMDYLAVECCQVCVMCQLLRELDYMGL